MVRLAPSSRPEEVSGGRLLHPVLAALASVPPVLGLALGAGVAEVRR